jgi:hypothetical protein
MYVVVCSFQPFFVLLVHLGYITERDLRLRLVIKHTHRKRESERERARERERERERERFSWGY